MSSKTFIRTGRKEFDELVPSVGSFLRRDVLELEIDGRTVRGFRSPDAKSIWIRDHSDMLRVGRYFEPDVTSAVGHFADTQSSYGRIFDYVSTYPEKPPSEKENWTKYVRVPVEADVEYRFVKAAYLAWQATSDDEWIGQLLPAMEKALSYIHDGNQYWDKKHGLVKRPYTIDTWDFAYTDGVHDWLQFQIDENTYWGIFHGDNSGYCEAFRILSFLYDRFGEGKKAAQWSDRALALQKKTNQVCWNGEFYEHFVKLDRVKIAGVDEAAQLSLSNPMNINRGVSNHEMAVSILKEYLRRREDTDAFAEWFSIDPPFPDGIFGDEKLVAGAYVNGGIMPLVGGELAKAAFDHGFEEYGVDILRRYHALLSEQGESYLWYFPDGTPASIETSTSPEAEPTDGWGSSAMLYALIAGLAGVEDVGKGFDSVKLAPRWPAARIQDAQVHVEYASSGTGIGYEYRCGGDKLEMEVVSSGCEAQFHVLLPKRKKARLVTLDGKQLFFDSVFVESSRYVDFSAKVSGEAQISVHFS